MSIVTTATIANTSPERSAGGYFSATELQTYLQENWPRVPVRGFMITQHGDRLNFMAPREFDDADWRILIRRAAKRRRTNSDKFMQENHGGQGSGQGQGENTGGQNGQNAGTAATNQQGTRVN